MSSAKPTTEIDYPESDGQPMGETDLHIHWMIRIRDILKQRYRDERVYVGSDLLVYYEEGNPRRFVVPDDFVVFDCPPGNRRIFQTWNEDRVLDVVFEVTSRSTARDDSVFKPNTYQMMGVRELFLYDPEGEYLKPSLRGFRLLDGELVPIETTDSSLRSELLGVDLRLAGDELEFLDLQTGKHWLTAAESAEQKLQAAEDDRHAEQAARIAAEAEVERLKAEIERLRNNP